LKIEVKLLLSANRKSYMPCRLAHQRTTFNGRFARIARYICGSWVSCLSGHLIIYPDSRQ